MLALNDVSMQFGGEYLFRNVSLRIGDRDRIAIVGPNGAGKSTLMKIVHGIIDSESGAVSRSRSTTTGYLPQDGVHNVGRTLYDEAASAFDDLLALHDRVEDIAREISRRAETGDEESEELKDLVHELGEVQLHLEHKEGYNIETRVKMVLSGLGFRANDFDRGTEEFSGGWQMRIELAKLLLREPAVLLLDEPTNHLDIDSLEWLEGYLRNYEGSVVLVSHDSRFLDNLTSRTIEVSGGKLTSYSGNYTFYLTARETRQRQLEAEFENQQEKIRQTKLFIERFRYKATKARQVQSRIKMLEKMDLVELEDEEGSIHFSFPPPQASGRIVMELDRIAKSYGPLHLFDELSFTIERGDRLAFLGMNGAGKSTLARIIAGIELISGGERRIGHNVSIGYYAQHQAEELDPKKTVFETVEEIATGDVRKRLRTLLGCFLFSGDDVFKRVAVLSGGERSRLALAKMLLTPSNLLILDEPTNHLDLRSKAVLQNALMNFEGTYIIVSHDRDFLEPIVNKVIEITSDTHGQHSNLRTIVGSVGYYLERKRDETVTPVENDPPHGEATFGREKREVKDKDRKRIEAEARHGKYKRLKPLKDTLAGIESSIAQLESRQAELEAELADPATYHDEEKARRVNAEYKTLRERLNDEYFRWSAVQEEIDAIEKLFT